MISALPTDVEIGNAASLTYCHIPGGIEMGDASGNAAKNETLGNNIELLSADARVHELATSFEEATDAASHILHQMKNYMNDDMQSMVGYWSLSQLG